MHVLVFFKALFREIFIDYCNSTIQGDLWGPTQLYWQSCQPVMESCSYDPRHLFRIASVNVFSPTMAGNALQLFEADA